MVHLAELPLPGGKSIGSAYQGMLIFGKIARSDIYNTEMKYEFQQIIVP